MTENSPRREQLAEEIATLRHRLEESEATIRAISSGEVDAFVVRQGADDQVLVLDGVDRPYRLLIERMHQGAATLDKDGTIIYVNRRLAELLHVTPGALLATPLSEYVVPKDREILTDLLENGDRGEAERELELKARDGTIVPVRLAASPLVSRTGIICVIVTDLTYQRRQGAERDRLLREQAARAAAESAAAILRDADRRKDEFLAMLAHELRGPLGPIRNGIEILDRMSSEDPVVQQTAAMIARQVEDLVRLVDDLLDVSRIAQGKVQLQLERVDLKDVVGRALENVRSEIEKRGHELHIELPAEPLPVDADVTRLTQVMNNLLNNAAKFTARGGRISLVAERTPGSSELRVRVRDTGVGMAPEMLPVMFELFAQADPSVSRAEGGLGIGLALSRRLVELHGGELEGFSPGVGRGSEFVIRLRLAEGAVAAPARRERPRLAEPGPRRRILIVDDNRDAAASLGELLRLRGHDVRYEHDGARGLAIAAAFEPEVVLLDIGLPGISGHDVAKKLRADPRFRNIAIVAVSGYSGEAQRERSLAAGFDEHLVKPVQLDVLEALLAAPSWHVQGSV